MSPDPQRRATDSELTTTLILNIEVQSLQAITGAWETSLDPTRYDSFSFSSSPGWERMRLRFESDFDGNIDGFTLDDATNPKPQRFEKVQTAGGSVELQ